MDGDIPLPRGVKRLRDRAAIVAEIDARSDDDTANTAEAAIYLDVSRKTLLRWTHGYDRRRAARLKRSVGEKGDIMHVAAVPGAPRAIKHVAAGSTARNQQIFWLVGDLKRFKRETSETVLAFESPAVSSFAARMDRFAQERPWFAADGIIVGEATSAPKAIFDAWKSRDGSIELLSLSLIEAMCDYDWKKVDDRAPWDIYFRDSMNAFADEAMSASAARQQSMRFKGTPANPGGRTSSRARSRS